MLRNNFTERSRELFIWNTTCWWCGQNHANCLHHILNRVSKSPLNAAPIGNFECHIGNGKLSLFENKKMLLQKTLSYLLSNDYKLTDDDRGFMIKYNMYYKN